MPTRALNVLYIAYGSPKYRDQARFSVLSLLHFLQAQGREDVGILVCTDNKDWLPQHPLIQGVPITAQEISDYAGPLQFQFRIKILLPQKLIRETGVPLLLVDSDTRWLGFPEDLPERLNTPGADGRAQFCMHLKEGDFSAQFFPSYQEAIHQHAAKLKTLGGVGTIANEMWNAGALGIPAGSADFSNRVLTVTEFLLPRLKPRDWIEQYAYTMVGMQEYDLFALGDCLHHYWNQNFEVPFYLCEAFSDIDKLGSIEERAAACAKIEWDDARIRELQHDPAIVKLRRKAKWRRSMRKRKIDLLCWLASLKNK